MIGVDDLLHLILKQVRPLPARRVDGVLGRGVLAADLAAVDPLPPFDNSAMDGYAVRREDLRSIHRLHVVGQIHAGEVATTPLSTGAAVRVATGAPLPPGADTVVPLEQARLSGEVVQFVGDVPQHGHVRSAGEDVAAGATVARTGQRLTGELMALTEAVGVRGGRVIPIPNIAIMTTGDELVGPRLALTPGSMRDVNSLLLAHAIDGLDMRCQFLGIFPDDPDRIAAQLSAPHLVDAVVICGGLGPGRKDVVARAVAQAGTVRTFEVAMRPGKAFAFGRARSTPVYALPGNPGAALAMFHALVAPALRVLSGRPPHPPPIHARLTARIDNPGGRRHYVRATLAWDGPTLAATPTGRQGSGLVSDIVAADALIVVPETADHTGAGDVLQVLPLKPIGGP